MKFNFILLFLFSLVIDVFGQEKFLPASPEVSQLTKYNQSNISAYSGQPNINIDLYSIQQDDFMFPLNLSYTSGGIKVDEVATWVGLGWNLNAGGAITRTIRGEDDLHSSNIESNIEYAYGGMSPDLKAIGTQSANINMSVYSVFENLFTSKGDTEPDIFYYNFGSFSGKFILFSNGEYQTIPKNNYKITKELSGNRWIIRTDDGTQYVFGKSIDEVNSSYEYTEQPSSIFDIINSGEILVS